jgi:hypothetical protein
VVIAVQYVEGVRGSDGDPARLSARQRLEFHRFTEASLKLVPSGFEPFVLPLVYLSLRGSEVELDAWRRAGYNQGVPGPRCTEGQRDPCFPRGRVCAGPVRV